jgi:hypothetical protein
MATLATPKHLWGTAAQVCTILLAEPRPPHVVHFCTIRKSLRVLCLLRFEEVLDFAPKRSGVLLGKLERRLLAFWSL